MKQHNKHYFVVREDILPEGIVKTAQVKELIRRGECSSVPEATERLGIAKSTFYKYRDGVFDFYDLGTMQIANLTLSLDHRPGILSRVLNLMADCGGNVLTINQSLPSHGAAIVTLSVGTDKMTDDPGQLIERLSEVDGVLDVRIDGVS